MEAIIVIGIIVFVLVSVIAGGKNKRPQKGQESREPAPKPKQPPQKHSEWDQVYDATNERKKSAPTTAVYCEQAQGKPLNDMRSGSLDYVEPVRQRAAPTIDLSMYETKKKSTKKAPKARTEPNVQSLARMRGLLSSQNVLNGFIMGEILGSPKAIKK